jgi:uncharacterized repeat protein (TIGR01451 family)
VIAMIGALSAAAATAIGVPLAPPTAATGTTVVADGFDRPDAGLLGSADTGQAWSAWAGAASIDAGTARASAPGYTLAVVDAGVSAGSVSMTVPALAEEFWLVVRASDSGSYWRFGRWQGGPYQLQQVTGWNLGSPAVDTISVATPAAGDRVSCAFGVALSCSVDGAPVVRTATPGQAGATHVGFAVSEPGGATARFDDFRVTVAAPAPDVSVDVVTDAAVVDAGAPLSWTVVVRNDGNAPAPGAEVRGQLPAGVATPTVTGTAGPCESSGGSWRCTIAALEPGATSDVTVAGHAPAEPGPVTLEATGSTPGDSDAANDGGASTVTVVPAGTVVVDDFERPDAASLGSTVTGQPWSTWAGAALVDGGRAGSAVGGYTLAVVDTRLSTGTVAVSVPVLSDELWLVFRASDSGNYWRFGRWQGGGYQLQQVQGWALGTPELTTLSLPVPAAGDRLSCESGKTITCSVDGVPVVRTASTFNKAATNAGFAIASGSAPASRFDDLLVVAPPDLPDLVTTVSSGAATAAPGAAVTWDVAVANEGTSPALAVEVSAAVPAGLADAAMSTPSGPCAADAGSWTCPVGAVAAGSSIHLTVTGTAPSSAAQLTLTVTAMAGRDLDPGSNTATTSVRVPPPGAVLLDGFDRADAAGWGTADTGQAWQPWSGATRVAGGHGAPAAPGYALVVAPAGREGRASVRVVDVSTELWLVVRASDPGNYWRFGRWQGGGYQLQLVRGWMLGAPAVTALGAVTPADGDVLECRLLAALTCSVNGTDVVTTLDGTNATAELVGLAAGGDDAATARFDDVAFVTPAPAPDLVADVAATPRIVDAGSPATWDVVVANAGNRPATNVTVRGDVPSGLTAVTAVAPGSTCAVDAAWTCSLGDLAVGGSRTVTISGTAPTVTASLALTATAGATEADRDPTTDSAGAVVEARAAPPPGARLGDDFDRPDAPALGSTVTGQPWTVLTGALGITAGQVGATGTGFAIAVVDPGWTFGTYTVRLAEAEGAWVVFRARDAQNHFRLGADASGFYRVQKVVDGVVHDPAFQTVRLDVRPTDGDVVRIVTRPDDGYFVAVNGRHVLDGGDVGLMHEFRFGIAASGASSARFDDLAIGQTLTSGLVTSDGFDAPDGTELGTSVGTTYPWVMPDGFWISSAGDAVLDSPGYGLAWLQTSSELGDARVRLESTDGDAWLVFRYAEDGSYFRFGRGGGAYRVERLRGDDVLAIPGGVEQVAAPVPAAGDLVEVRQDLDGSVRCVVDGEVVARFRDPVTNVRASSYGLAGTHGAAFDDFAVVAR